MIAIVNVSPQVKETGTHQYEVRINRTPLVRFEHDRENGLAACLRAAAEAIDEQSHWDSEEFASWVTKYLIEQADPRVRREADV